MCERGLYVELGAFKHNVYLDFVEVADDAAGHFAQLNHHLNGQGVESINEALKEYAIAPLLQHFDRLLSSAAFQEFSDQRLAAGQGELDTAFEEKLGTYYVAAIETAAGYVPAPIDVKPISASFNARLGAILRVTSVPKRFRLTGEKKYANAMRYLLGNLEDKAEIIRVIYGWLVLHQTGRLSDRPNKEEQAISLCSDWLLFKRVNRLLSEPETQLLRILIRWQNWHTRRNLPAPTAYRVLLALLADTEVQQFVGINRYDNVLWFNKERFETLLWGLFFVAVVHHTAEPRMPKKAAAQAIFDIYQLCASWLKAKDKSDYQVERLLKNLQGKASPAAKEKNKTQRKSRKNSVREQSK
jgi:hypothetical protein